MPELPEVETTVRDLRKEVLDRKIEDVWSDSKKMVKKPKSFGKFQKEIIGKKIKKIGRRGKNILFGLSGNKTLLIHQKLTGHLLLGRWKKIDNEWRSLEKGPLLDDPMNKFLHFIFWLDNGKQLALSDLRKFAKVELWGSEELEESGGWRDLGLNPVGDDFSFEKFKLALSKRKKGRIKQVLMDQKIIAGIGNIYSDEILWEAKVHPLRDIKDLREEELKRIYLALRKILKIAIEVKGESISDFRKISGEKGGFDPLRKVYRRQGEKCLRCGAIIQRIKIGGRSAYFCPDCQKL